MNRLITLLTDFGFEDNFVGIIKGVIMQVNPEAITVDISHKVRPHDIFAAAFLLEGAYKYFPKGSIHAVVVDPGVGTERNIILVKTRDYFFIAPDNGVLGLALKNEPVEKIVEVTNSKYFLRDLSCTFHGRDIIAPVAAFLSKGAGLNRFGKEIRYMREIALPPLVREPNRIIGKIIYIDSFGNIITNVKGLDIKGISANLRVKIKDKIIAGLNKSYSSVEKNSPLNLINSFGYLEISVNCARAKDFFGVEIGECVELLK